MTMLSADDIVASRCRNVAAIFAWVSPAASRSSNGFNPAKIAPAFDAFVNVAPSNPANATACSTPGVARMICVAALTAALVRSSELPAGSCIASIR